MATDVVESYKDWDIKQMPESDWAAYWHGRLFQRNLPSQAAADSFVLARIKGSKATVGYGEGQLGQEWR